MVVVRTVPSVGKKKQWMMNKQKSRVLIWCSDSQCNWNFSIDYADQNELQQAKAKLPMQVYEQTIYDKKGKVIRISRGRYCLNCFDKL
jgi:hypothetical protein